MILLAMTESPEDQLKRYRRERALWSLEGLMTGCIERENKEELEALTNLENVLNELMRENAELRAALRRDDFRDAVEHLNKAIALADLTLPPTLLTVADAALFLLRAHRESGTQIRASVYDYAVALERNT